MPRGKGPNHVEFLPDGTVRMKLTQGKSCILDMEDYPKIKDYRWCAKSHGRTFYAITGRVQRLLRGTSLFMHQWIMPGFDMLDHINGDGLDNRKANLRPANSAENQHNARMRVDNKTGFRGVSFHMASGKYQALIQANKKSKYLGLFDTPEDAATAYDDAAIALHGDFSKTNEALGLIPSRSIQ